MFQEEKDRAVGPPGWGHALLAIVFGLALVRMSADRLPRLGGETWPTATGRVTGTSISVYNEWEDGTSYQPSVIYEYAVGGQSFAGTAAGRDFGSYPSQMQAEEMLRSFPKGRSVTVYYNPQDASRSMLVPGVHDLFGYLILSLGGIGVVGSFGWSVLRWLLNRPQA